MPYDLVRSHIVKVPIQAQLRQTELSVEHDHPKHEDVDDEDVVTILCSCNIIIQRAGRATRMSTVLVLSTTAQIPAVAGRASSVCFLREPTNSQLKQSYTGYVGILYVTLAVIFSVDQLSETADASKNAV